MDKKSNLSKFHLSNNFPDVPIEKAQWLHTDSKGKPITESIKPNGEVKR
jgi:hypothetical protein